MPETTRRDWLKQVTLGGILWAALSRSATGAEQRPPNIIFILADDLGYGDLGCYGQTQFQTPNLDQMAAEGLRFTDCYAGSTVCAPSRCCLMTGFHTGHAWVRGNALVPLRPEDTTVAEVLKKAGYSTGLVGKWGLGEPDTTGIPTRKGFDEFFGYLNQKHAHNYYPEYLWQNETQIRLEGNTEGKPGVSTERSVYTPELFASKAADFITRHKDHPFFLFFSPTIPHGNNERLREDGVGMEVPSDAPYSDKPWPQEQKNKAAMITFLDGIAGRIFQQLKNLGLDDNTIVFFTSDNGPHKEGADPALFKSSGPFRGIKRDLYEGGIRVPMLVRWPGKITPGTVSPFPWAFWDFLPTAAELAGSTPPQGIDGQSILQVLLGHSDTLKPHEYLYWEFHEGGFKQAVRIGNFKVVRPQTKADIEIYDLSNDSSETQNIAPDHPEIVKQAATLFKSARTENPKWPGT
ncbi:MAG TPA: arylsulfatase [Candidatus Hydrogenedentes bacterium]|nr:arylsulfatase [Candidatus Hydrogenedentota bacterium]